MIVGRAVSGICETVGGATTLRPFGSNNAWRKCFSIEFYICLVINFN